MSMPQYAPHVEAQRLYADASDQTGYPETIEEKLAYNRGWEDGRESAKAALDWRNSYSDLLKAIANVLFYGVMTVLILAFVIRGVHRLGVEEGLGMKISRELVIEKKGAGQ